MGGQYRTIADKSEGFLKDRGSKFYAYAAPVENEDAAKRFVDEVQEQHPKCRHICFAYRIGMEYQPDGKQGQLFRTNDAGEPMGSAGQPILNQIDAGELTNVIVVVARYFGGTKLGFSGLLRAYRAAAVDALDRATIVTGEIKDQYQIRCSFERMDQVMNFLSQDGVSILGQEFEKDCLFRIEVDEKRQTLLDDLRRFPDITIESLPINS